MLLVIGYASRALSDAERRYCVTRRELLGVVYGPKKYRQHLLGRSLVFRTDHAALTYIMKTPEPVGQQGRWLDLLGEYDITIQHRPGLVYGNSDALSRRPCDRDGGADCRQCKGHSTVAPASSEAPAAAFEPAATFPPAVPLPPVEVISPAERLSPAKASTPAATCSPAAAVTPAAEGVQGASRFPACRRKRRASKGTKQSVIDVDVRDDEIGPAGAETDERPADDGLAEVRTLEEAPESDQSGTSLSLDGIRQAQSVDDSLRPVIELLRAGHQPNHADIRQYPEEARVLLAQWDSSCS